MRPAWRLAISSARARPSRTMLLVGAVVLSAAMIAAVSCAMASITRAVGVRLDQTIGRAELRLKAAGSGKGMEPRVLERVRGWAQVQDATGRSQAPLAVAFRRGMWIKGAGPGEAPRWRTVECVGTAAGNGIDPDREPVFRAVQLVAGRLAREKDEIVVDEAMVERFGNPKEGSWREVREGSAVANAGAAPANEADLNDANATGAPKIGDSIELIRFFKAPRTVKIVGIVAQPPFGARWQCYMTVDGLAEVTGQATALSEVDIILKREAARDAEALAVRWGEELGRAYLIQTTERITSGLEKNMKGNELGFVLATVMAFLAASFIIMTGLSTAVTERMRELSVLRCIGATRGQLATIQLVGGGLVGSLGGVIGVPLGVALAWGLARHFSKELPTGLAISRLGLGIAVTGAIGAGLLGAVFPAWRAARVTPLGGLSVRAVPPSSKMVGVLLLAGLALLGLELAIVFVPRDGQVVFWGYATTGLPAMFVGYFLLGVPVLVAVTHVVSGVVNRVLGLPRHMLGRTLRNTPFRYGFTASAMMSGLAIMVALWTQGRAIMRDWMERFEFPDAFVTGLNLTPTAQERLAAMPFVTGTCAITLHPIETGVFGVHALQRYKSMFIAFEPEPFFRMTRLSWVEPKDAAGQERAKRRLAEGDAVLVAREFQVARGVKVGDRFEAKANEVSHEFEIVGVVTSPGLEIVSKFFAIGEDFTDQALHAVFGSRDDLRRVFGSEAINLIQVGLDPKCDDAAAVAQIRTELLDCGLLDAGSGRRIKEEIRKFVGGSLVVASSVAVFAMLISSFGVANIIVAGIHARRFEFGVLRAIGASRGQLVRLVLGEAVIIALTAMVLGTSLGLQGIFSGQRLDRLLFGLELTVRPPLGPIVTGWACVLVVTVGAAVPAAVALGRQGVRELLSSTKG